MDYSAARLEHGRSALTRRKTLPGFLLMIVISAFASWFTFNQFAAYDLSPLIDLFWRVEQKQLPERDFINTYPPILYLVARATVPFQLGWYELTAANIACTLAAYLAVIEVTPARDRSASWSIACAVVLGLPLIYTNHLWYSGLSQIAAAVFFFAIYRALIRDALRPRCVIWIVVASAIIVLTKQNIAAPIIAVSLVLIAIGGGPLRWKIIGAIVGGAVLGLLVGLPLAQMTLGNFVRIYTSVIGRGLPTTTVWAGILQVPSSWAMLSWLGFAAAILIFHTRKRFGDRADRFALLMFPVALYPVLTDYDAKFNNVTLPLFIVAACLWRDRGVNRTALRKGDRVAFASFNAILGLFLMTAIYGGVVRERMRSAGGGDTFWAHDTESVNSGYFAGMNVSHRFTTVLDEIDKLKDEHTGKRLFFGPRIEFAYRASGMPSPKAMPLWWHPGTSYALEDQPRVMSAFANARYPILVFLGKDRTRAPLEWLQYVDDNYRKVPGWKQIEVYELVSPRLSEAANGRHPNARSVTFID